MFYFYAFFTAEGRQYFIKMKDRLEEKLKEGFELEVFQIGNPKEESGFISYIKKIYSGFCDNLSYYTGW